MSSDEDKKSSTANQMDATAGLSRFATIVGTLNKGVQSPFVKKLVALVAETASPSPKAMILTQAQALQVSMQLSKVLEDLTEACADQKHRLTNGVMPWDRINSTRVATSLQALSGIADRLARAVAALTAASQQTAAPSQPLTPSSDNPWKATTAPSLLIVRLGASKQRISHEQIQQVAESMRGVHQYVIDVAGQIKSSMAGAAGTNPFTLDGALAETNMLALVLRDALPKIQEMLLTPEQ